MGEVTQGEGGETIKSVQRSGSPLRAMGGQSTWGIHLLT